MDGWMDAVLVVSCEVGGGRADIAQGSAALASQLHAGRQAGSGDSL
jgi:hypothetical protein